jgi:hypothetical protein
MIELFYWSKILECIESGIAGNADECRAHAEGLVLWLEQAGETRKASRLQDILNGKDKGQIITIAKKEGA